MTWNHRLVREEKPYKLGDEEKVAVHYYICEAYYDDNGKIWAITGEITPMGMNDGISAETDEEALVDLKQELEWMLEAMKHPIIDPKNIPEEGAINLAEEIDDEKTVSLEEAERLLAEEIDPENNHA